MDHSIADHCSVLFGLPLAAFRSEASDPVDVRSEEVVVLRRCLIDHERTTSLGSAFFGVLKECFVEPGD